MTEHTQTPLASKGTQTLPISQSLGRTPILDFPLSPPNSSGAVSSTSQIPLPTSHHTQLCSKEIPEALRAQKSIKENEKIS